MKRFKRNWRCKTFMDYPLHVVLLMSIIKRSIGYMKENAPSFAGSSFMLVVTRADPSASITVKSG